MTRRRDFLGGVGSAAITAGTGVLPGKVHAATYAFAHGVASGDPLPDRLVIWTRITATGDAAPRVYWEVSTDADFSRIVRSGLQPTDSTRDFTVKVDVGGLQPGTLHHYRFVCGGLRSPAGRARTLPAGDVAQVKLAVLSCANYPAGFFNVYAQAARMDGLDAALHLGDFIYEYERNGYASGNAAALGREVLPPHECLSLADYRQRYAQYRSDPDLQAFSAALPLIAVWDDHEVANNSYVSGAGEHTDDEGPYAAREAAALRAYHEWLPTRLADPSRPMHIYRSFHWGQLLSLHMLETRRLARSKQLSYTGFVGADGLVDGAALETAASAAGRQMMGRTQMDWLKGQLAASQATWQVLGQQVRMARTRLPAAVVLGQVSCGRYAALRARADAGQELSRAERFLLAQPPVTDNLDAWDGYGAERDELLRAAADLDRNLVSLAGDTHNAWANDLRDAQGRAVGVEFATSSVSSPGLEASRLTDTPAFIEQWLLANSPTLRYAETAHRGFMVLTVTHAACRADWHFVSTVQTRAHDCWQGASLQALPGAAQRRLTAVARSPRPARSTTTTFSGGSR